MVEICRRDRVKQKVVELRMSLCYPPSTIPSIPPSTPPLASTRRHLHLQLHLLLDLLLFPLLPVSPPPSSNTSKWWGLSCILVVVVMGYSPLAICQKVKSRREKEIWKPFLQFREEKEKCRGLPSGSRRNENYCEQNCEKSSKKKFVWRREGEM